MPREHEHERILIFAAFQNHESAARAIAELSADHFLSGRHAEIWEACLQAWERRGALERATVRPFLDAAALRYLDELLIDDLSPTTFAIDDYIEEVHEVSARARLQDAFSSGMAALADRTTPIDRVVETAECTMRRLRYNAGSSRVSDAATTAAATAAYVDSMQEGGGLEIGFPALQAVMGRLQKAAVIVVAGRPSMGKTTFAMNVAANVAKSGNGVLIFSAEMSQEQLSLGWCARNGKIDTSTFREGTATSEQYDALHAQLSQYRKQPIYLCDKPPVTLASIRRTAREMKATNDIRLIVVDYIGLIECDRQENRQQEVATISRGLKSLVMELGVPIIVVSQLNRAVEQRESKRPLLSDLRESGAIEQDADVVLLLYRDEYYKPDTNEPGVAEVRVAKNRNGAVGVEKLGFVGEHNEFSEHVEMRW